jgi:shikimate dehydrogenase
MTDRYAVIGNPIGHTRSPFIHGLFAQSTDQDIEYTAIEGPTGSPQAFADALLAFRDSGGKGMNVTAPFKMQAFDLATDRLDRARIAGATNALKFEGDRIAADNFDGVGLLRDIQRNLGVALEGKRVLLLGAGGAVRGALLPFLAARPAELVLANRDAAKARALVNAFAIDGPVVDREYGELANEWFDVVVNATSASLRGELPPLPVGVFSQAELAYELAYGKGLTPFLRLARNAGVGHLADGVGMLVEQAAEAFAWWRGVRPDTRPVIARLTVPLA